MILSVSRRTDIPAFYSDWFFERVKEGFCFCENPFFPNGKVAKIKIEPVRVTTNLLSGKEVTGNVDGIIFWTKNPRPMTERKRRHMAEEHGDDMPYDGTSILGELDRRGFKYYFHFTLNPYDKTIESNVPPLDERIKTFQDLSKMIGAERVIWRYDPILLSKDIDVAWQVAQFKNLCEQLGGFTKTCHTSFLICHVGAQATPQAYAVAYASGIGKPKDIHAPNYTQQHEIMREFARLAKQNGIQLCACAQKQDWSQYGVKASRCTDPELFARLNGGRVKTKRLDGQRKHCGCMPCVDIGVYNTCTNGCVYCYANGFYAYRGEPKSMLDKLDGEVYERKTERLFEY